MASGGTKSRKPRRRQNLSDLFPDIHGPPAGTFDPGLEYQRQQDQIGLLDLLQNIHRSNRSARVDTRVGRHQARLQTGRTLQDIAFGRQGTKQSFTHVLQDLATAEQRGSEDYQTALGNLGRKYTILGQAQTQSANARGVATEGGFAAQSAAKRAANQAVEQQPIQTAFERGQEDIATKRAREQQAFERQMHRFGTLGHRARTDLHLQLSDIARNLHRTLAQNRIQRSRGIRDAGLFNLAQVQQEFFAAHQQNPHIKFPNPNQLRRGVNRQGQPTGGHP